MRAPSGPSLSSRSRRGSPRGDHALCAPVEHEATVGNGQDRRQFMRHHHEGQAEIAPQVEDQPVEPGRGDRIEPGRGLVEQQQRRVERQRPGDRRPLGHAAGNLRRQQRRRIGQPDQAELQPRHPAARRAAAGRCAFPAAASRSPAASCCRTARRTGTSRRCAAAPPRAPAARRWRCRSPAVRRRPRSASAGRCTGAAGWTCRSPSRPG